MPTILDMLKTNVIEIADRKGLYREATTLLDYYQMRDPKNNVDKISYAQFGRNMILIENQVRIEKLRTKKTRLLMKTETMKTAVKASMKT